MKRFAYISADPGIPVPGTKGASIHVAAVCKELSRAGLDGEILTARAKGRRLAGFPVRPLARVPGPTGESASERERRLFLSARETATLPIGECDFVYERYSLWHAGGLVRARSLNVPFVLEVNSPLPDEAKRYRTLINDGLAEGIAWLLLTQADGVVCVSDEIARWVVERRGADDGVWVVPNGVDEELFTREGPRKPLPRNGSGPVIAFAGSFRPWHGTDDLLEAFRLLVQRIEGVSLLCVGDGPLRAEFERSARSAGLAGRIHLTGAVPHEEVPGWLRNADIAVVPYPPLERFYFSPLKLYEFMALGLPVVAAEVGQLTEVLRDRQVGRLYTPGRPEELAASLQQLLTRPAEARRMAEAGREWVLGRATWSRRVGTILDRIGGLTVETRRGVEVE